MPADKTCIFIVISLYFWDINLIFTHNAPTSENRTRNMQKTMILLVHNFGFVILCPNSLLFAVSVGSGKKSHLDIFSTKPKDDSQDIDLVVLTSKDTS